MPSEQEAWCGLQASVTGVSPSLLVPCLSLSSFHLHLLYSFSFPHASCFLFSNFSFLPLTSSALLFTCLRYLPQGTPDSPVAQLCQVFSCCFDPALFCSFLLSFSSSCCCLSFLFFHLPEIFFLLSNSTPFLYFSIHYLFLHHCFAISLIVPFHPFLFQVTAILHDNFLGSLVHFSQNPAESVFSAYHCK